MDTQPTATAAPIPDPVTAEWADDMRKRVLRNDPLITQAELRAAREHIRQRHMAAGMITRGKRDTEATLEAQPAVNPALDNW